VIRLREEKRLTGTVQATITPAEHGWAAEVAWVVGTPRQRRDIATEAARGLFARLLQQDVRVIRVHIHPDHHASPPPSPLPPAWLPPITGTTGGSGRSFASRWGNAR
jgi:ribosomal protein L16/L10AE